ncbi:MAG: hypothetical protein ACO31E_12245 [Phycisphaerales bacterium]|jgi:hypothetical protein
MQSPTNTPNPAGTAARRMTVYAITLVVLGLIGFGLAWGEAAAVAQAEAGDGKSSAPSLTPLIFTIGPALLMLAMAWMSRMIDRSKVLGMIGIHLGMLLPAVFGVAYAIVGWGRFTGWQAGEKPFANVLLFLAMILASLLATIGILKARPSKDARGV